MMSLTFEAANLDFSYYFKNKFKEIEDFKSAAIMQEVYDDEISHVKLGSHFLGFWSKDKELWDYYLENLLYPLTPARSKGISFMASHRKKAGLDKKFIRSLESYKDDFRITTRKK